MSARADHSAPAGERRTAVRPPPEPTPDSTFEALVFGWDSIAGGDADLTALRSRIEDLCASAVHVFVITHRTVGEVDTRLRARPAGPGRLFVCVDSPFAAYLVDQSGAAPLDTSEQSGAARWVAAWLADRGITGSLILIVDDAFEAISRGTGRARGGLQRLLQICDDQLLRRRGLRVPWIDEDPSWIVSLPTSAAMERTAESLGTVANGWAALRGSREEGGPGAAPMFAINGLYSPEPGDGLLVGPVWTRLEVRDGLPDRRLLDLRTGLLVRETDGEARLRTVRFVPATRPRALALRVEGDATRLQTGAAFSPARDLFHLEPGALSGTGVRDLQVAQTLSPGAGGVCVVVRDRTHEAAGRRFVDRLGAWDADPAHPPDPGVAAEALAELEQVGFEGLLAEHREEWARRWADATVVIEGDVESELAARFAMFHLLACAPDAGEAAVGARGLTGHAYGGHVFWDADVFVLPALAAVRPRAARALLEYRIRRLPAARAAAAAQGRHGARFPWESARDGSDVTPRQVRGGSGAVIPIVTGEQEEHIVADVAWAACEYASWTGDRGFLDGPGRDLVIETARYWASRITVDRDGGAHLRGVMGPDEYHEAVDDNAYTNVMARWNLRRAAQLVEDDGGGDVEAADWRQLADQLVDGWDPVRGAYQQFDGYWDLEPLLAASVAPPPFAADVLLGVDRVRGSQLIKQADVLMLHHLVPDECEAGSLASDLAFYEPRTSHGSSLSPAIHASLLARAGLADRALELFRIAARLDLDDLTGTTAGGLHMATMGGVWQALARGFLGMRPRDGVLDIDPCLPTSWTSLTVRLRFDDRPIGVRADHGSVTVDCDAPVAVRIAGSTRSVCWPPGRTFRIGSDTT